MKDIVINIPDMQSTHCQTRVSNAVKGIEGVQVQSLEAGKIAVSLATDKLKDEIVEAIEKAGYTVTK
ncbi:MAG TPA: heavy-metal-associated domain-containing protein [Chitinophagaceae bacterium]|nr:heavy-metal-associated domain-containing protein [Chitinophagaceae bacterium]